MGERMGIDHRATSGAASQHTRAVLLLVGSAALAACSGQSAAPQAAPPSTGSQRESMDVSISTTGGDEAEGGGEAQGPEVGEASRMVELDSLATELTTHGDELAEALAAVDCDGAANHRDIICHLAGRICSIAEEHPETAAADRCSDAGARCERATDDVAGACN